MSPGKEILEVSTTLPRGFDDLIESKPNNLQIYYVRFVLSFITVLRKKQRAQASTLPKSTSSHVILLRDAQFKSSLFLK